MLLSHRSKEKEQTIGNNRNNRDGHLISMFSEILQFPGYKRCDLRKNTELLEILTQVTPMLHFYTPFEGGTEMEHWHEMG